MKGKDLQKAIIDLAHLHGWFCAHFTNVLVSRKDGTARWLTPVAADGKGFPDLVLVRQNDRVIYAEIKGKGDRQKPEQIEWARWLMSAGQDVFLWTEADLNSGAINEVLRRGSLP